MFRRRDLMIGAGAFAALGGLRMSAAASQSADLGPPRPFDFEWLQGEAEQLAARPYEPPLIRYPDLLERLDYDAYQLIQF